MIFSTSNIAPTITNKMPMASPQKSGDGPHSTIYNPVKFLSIFSGRKIRYNPVPEKLCRRPVVVVPTDHLRYRMVGVPGAVCRPV
jgi:hypothetical protein